MNRRPFTCSKSVNGMGLDVFTEDSLLQIHLATLEVLETIGVRMNEDEALHIMADHGANVDFETKIVKIPAYMIEDAIRSAPRQFTLKGRTQKDDVLVGAGRSMVVPFGIGINVLDPYTQKARPSTYEDLKNISKAVDCLDDIDVQFEPVTPLDKPEVSAPLYCFEAALEYSRKPSIQGFEVEGDVEAYIEMLSIVSGGEDKIKDNPIMMGFGCPISPLTYDGHLLHSVIEFAKRGLPIMFISMAMGGGTSPYGVSGTMITHNAEVLSGIVLTQLVNKGNPVVYGSSTTIMDLKKGAATVGCPGLALIGATVGNLGRYYGIPSWTAGG